MIWCGKFNFIPNSPLYEFLKIGAFDFCNEKLEKINGDDINIPEHLGFEEIKEKVKII